MKTTSIKTKSANLTEEQFFLLCADNKELKFERDKFGNILLMAPTGIDTSSDNLEVNRQLANWNYKYKLGKAFESNAGFTLPNGAMRSPDAAWILKARYNKLPAKEKERFAHICPDFVIELLSKSDSLKATKEKMEEWIENGCRLAWLIDIARRTVYIYKPDTVVSTKNFETPISGENVLPKFKLDLKQIGC